MSQAVSPSLGKPYGLARVCAVWRVPRSSVYARRCRQERTDPPRRRGPQGPCSDQQLAGRIRVILQESQWVGEGHRKVWARLRFEGLRVSSATGTWRPQSTVAAFWRTRREYPFTLVPGNRSRHNVLLGGFAGVMLMSFVGFPALLAAVLDVSEDAALNRSANSMRQEVVTCGVGSSPVGAAEAERAGRSMRERAVEELHDLEALQRWDSEGGAVAGAVREDEGVVRHPAP